MNIISKIKRYYDNGGLYTSKYEILIIPPLGVGNITEKLSVLSKTASRPDHKISTSTISFKGRPIVMRRQLDMETTCTVDVYEDSNMKVRKVLDRWIDLCDSLYIGGSSNYCNGTIEVHQLDGNGNRMYGVVYNDVFLTGISGIKYDSSSSGEIVSYSLTFSYSGYEIINR